MIPLSFNVSVSIRAQLDTNIRNISQERIIPSGYPPFISILKLCKKSISLFVKFLLKVDVLKSGRAGILI